MSLVGRTNNNKEIEVNEELKTELENEFDELVSDKIDTISPYRLSAVVSHMNGRYVREQVVYSYVRQGLIPASKNSEGKWYVTRENAKNWCVKYTNNSITRGVTTK